MNTKLAIVFSTLSLATLAGVPVLSSALPSLTASTAIPSPPLVPMTEAQTTKITEAPPLKPVPPSLNFFSDLAESAVPAVISISISSKRPVGYRSQYGGNPQYGGNFDGQFRNPLEEFFGHQMMPGRPHEPNGLAPGEMVVGSGFVIDASGIALTNNHVVAQADEVDIQLSESETEKTIKGKVIGRDPDLDVALIKFTPPHKLTALKLGDSDALRVGEFVMAVGNPYGHGHSVSHGIVSAKGRALPGIPLASYLQTDAPINPGNSGGPLVNTSGEVIGINNAIDARAQGISYAIPINYVKKVLAQLQNDGKVSRGFIGASVAPVTPELAEKLGESKDLRAALVADISIEGPAARAGIRPYDIITRVGGEEVHSPSELILKVTSAKVGSRLPISLIRSGKKLELVVKVESRPGEEVISQR